MKNEEEYTGGENIDLRQILLKGRNKGLSDRTSYFNDFIQNLKNRNELQHLRCITSPSDREIVVFDECTGESRKMLMFGSNNYLGLANHPYVKAKTEETIRKYGVGIGGPPLLNGYMSIHRELEERLADMKASEDCLIFSSGYGANVGLVSGLMNKSSILVHDKYSHASLLDGINMAGVKSAAFKHNDIEQMRMLLNNVNSDESSDVFVGVEGVYSMDGDTAPLDQIVKYKKSSNAILIVDDAHGTGTMGEHGHGTAEHYGVEDEIDITMGTFSKTFAVTGGFITASKQIVNYLRFFARSYMFSASLPPIVIASVLAGLDVMENEKQLLRSLRENIDYANRALQNLGFKSKNESAIITLLTPPGMNVRKAAHEFHKQGIFLNSIEYPAVPLNQQRFRISIMATHTNNDIDRLIECVESVWSKHNKIAEEEQLLVA